MAPIILAVKLGPLAQRAPLQQRVRSSQADRLRSGPRAAAFSLRHPRLQAEGPIPLRHVCRSAEGAPGEAAKGAAEAVATNGANGANGSATAEAAVAAAAPAAPVPAKKPRLPYLDSLRFFLIAYIATGHFIGFASPSPFVAKLFSQVNVVVGAFFVLSGYVAAYVATELNEYKASPRIKPAVTYFVGRVAGYYPLYALVNILFAPMFIWVDQMYNGPIKAAFHAVVTFTLTQAWFPTSAELWNPPTWFLSALTFAMLVLPYALPYIAEWRKEGLKRALATLTGVSVLAKVAFTYDVNAWTIFEGLTSPKMHPNHLLWNMQRFHPFYAVLEVLIGAVACRLVMTDGAEGGKPKGGALASAAWPLLGMLAVLVARAGGYVQMNDPIARGVFFIPLFTMFLVRLHRRAVAPEAKEQGPGLLAQILSFGPLLYLGALSFPIYILHGPIGQVFYKKAVATKLWGGVMSKIYGPWFFGVYWLVVLVGAALVNKFFINNPDVQSWTKDNVKKISAALRTG